MHLHQNFVQLVIPYASVSHADQLWNEIQTAYTHKGRHYHNLDHLTNLLNQLLEVKTGLADWDTILFTLYYHDVVYHPLKSDNEEQSAALAEQRMLALKLPMAMIEKCKDQILATKAHRFTNDADTDYFTDADLSILGVPWEEYQRYAANVRREYAIYPDLIYKPGRKKVLKHFLAMERIYKTDHFHEQFEEQARLNLTKELASQ